MKIERVTTNGFRGLPDRTFDLVEARGGRPFDLVFVTGPAGCGKTSFLEAIIAAKEDVGPYAGRSFPPNYTRYGERGAKVRVDWLLGEEERARAGTDGPRIATESIFGEALGPPPDHDPGLVSILAEYDRDPAVGKVEYFHAGRRLPAVAGARGIAAAAVPQVDRAIRLTRDDAKYAALVEWVVEVTLGLDAPDPNAREERPTGARLAEAFAMLCPSKRIEGVARRNGVIVPRFVDARGIPSGIAELTDSERQALLFAATFLRAGLNGSLVLVDTPELHLGGADARAFVQGLARIGADNQLIVATASAEVLEGAAPGQVIRLDAGRA